jgi:hypothetical protein
MALLALAAASFTGCALLAPVSREEYVLVRLNGDTIPANLWQGRGGVDGRLAENRILWSKLSLFEGGRFAWDVKQVILLDGAPDPDFPQRESRTLGRFEKRDTILALSWMFHARVAGDTVFMRDVSGVFERALFEFVRLR